MKMATVWLAVHIDTVYKSRKLVDRYPYLKGVQVCKNKIVGALDNQLSVKAVENFNDNVIFYDNEESFYYKDVDNKVVICDNNNKEGLELVLERGKIKKNDIVLVVDVDGYKKKQNWHISMENIYGFDVGIIKELRNKLIENGIKARYRIRYKIDQDSTYLISKYGIRTMAVICPVYPVRLHKSDRINGYQHSMAGTWTYYDTYCRFKKGLDVIYNYVREKL